MNRLERRVDALEGQGKAELSPTVKAWLGQPLTAIERAALEDNSAGTDPDFDDFSEDAKEWLTQ